MHKKKCPKCGGLKDLDNFYHENGRPDGHSCWCKDCIRKKSKEYNMRNSIKVANRQKVYRAKNSQRISSVKKEWYYKNREHILSQKKEYEKRQRDVNELYNAKKKYRHILRRAFRKKYPIRDDAVREIVGCGCKYFQQHLKRTWRKRYGHEWNGEPCNIDHIVPLCKATTVNEIIRLCHYTNLQLLTPEDNQKKGDK